MFKSDGNVIHFAAPKGTKIQTDNPPKIPRSGMPRI